MASRSLSAQPNLEQTRNRAKTLLKALRSADPDAVSRFRDVIPQLADASDQEITGAKLSLRDAQRVIALEYGFDDWAALKQHIEATVNGSAVPEKLSALIHAIDTVDAASVEQILQSHPQLAATTVYPDPGWSLLVWAQASVFDEETDAHLRIVKTLIDHGADMNDGGNHDPPLATGAWIGNLGTVELLIAGGADVSYRSDDGETLVAIAAGQDQRHTNGRTVEALIDAGAEYTVGDLVKAGLEDRIVAELDRDPSLVNRPVPLWKEVVIGPPMHAGLHTDRFHHEDDREARTIALLLDRGADIEAKDNLGYTVLQRAAEMSGKSLISDAHKSRAIVELLQTRGAMVDPFVTVALGDVEGVKAVLRQDPSQVHARRSNGETLLHVARKMGHERIADVLLGHGADEQAETSTGGTPVDAQVDHLGGVLDRHMRTSLDMGPAVEAADLYWSIAASVDRPIDERARLFGRSASVSLVVGDLPRATRYANALQDVAEQAPDDQVPGDSGPRSNIWHANALNGRVSFCQGDWDSARRSFDYCTANPQGVLGEWAFHGTYALLEAESGNRTAAEHQLAICVERAQESSQSPNPVLQGIRAFVGVWIGHLYRSEDMWLEAERHGQKRLALPIASGLWQAPARMALGVIAVGRGDKESAQVQYEELLPYRGVMIWGYPPVPVTDRILGLLAQTTGRLDDAAVHFEDAIAFCANGLEPEQAHTSYDYAGMLLARDGPEDRQKAASLRNEALALSSKLGMRPLRERVRASQLGQGQ